MLVIAILGAESLLGKHLIEQALSDDFASQVHCIRAWTKFNAGPKDGNVVNSPKIKIEWFVGGENLAEALAGADIVINAHQATDFSASPNKRLLVRENVDFIHTLLDRCAETKVRLIVHVSSILTQCTVLMPNVCSRELPLDKKRWLPCKAYASTKQAAEAILEASHVSKIVVARIGDLYGEGDSASPVCDAILTGHYLGFARIIGDQRCSYQMSYAGNIAHSLLHVATQSLSMPLAKPFEVVNLHDDTPVTAVHRDVIARLVSTPFRHLSYIFLLPLLLLLAGIQSVFEALNVHSKILAALPSPVYVYCLFRHWLFVSTFKQHNFYGDKIKYSHEEVLKRCAAFYSSVQVADISRFSWMASERLQ